METGPCKGEKGRGAEQQREWPEPPAIGEEQSRYHEGEGCDQDPPNPRQATRRGGGEPSQVPPTVARSRPQPLPQLLGREAHPPGRWRLACWPKLGLQYLFRRPWTRLGEGRARLL